MSRLGTLPSNRVTRLALCLATVATLAVGGAACTSGGTPNGGGGGEPTIAFDNSRPGQAPAPASRCDQSGNDPVAKMVLTTSDGVKLAAARFGSGPRGVVLLPQRGVDFCPWWYFAMQLVNRGFQVMAVDLRGTGYSEAGDRKDYAADAAAAVSALHDAGAQRVVIMGASQGANVALVAAGRIPDKVAGVVALSYTDNAFDATDGASGTGPRTPAEAAPLTTSAILLCWAQGDRQISAAKPQVLYDRAGTADKKLIGRAGVTHGWDMLKVGDDDVTAEVMEFVEAHA